MNKIVLGLTLLTPLTWANGNQVAKDCLDKHQDWDKTSDCFSTYIIEQQLKRDAELRDFLKHNPRYMAPGQSLNKCFGKPREQVFESIEVTKTEDGHHILVKYKERMPKPCYQNAPWDNRDEKQINNS